MSGNAHIKIVNKLTQKRSRRNQQLGITLCNNIMVEANISETSAEEGQTNNSIILSKTGLTTFTVKSDTPLSANSSSYKIT